MYLKYVYVVLLFYVFYQFKKCNTESITFISTEHPVVTWFDTKFFTNVTLSSRRHSRDDPRYYVDLYVKTLFTINNNFKGHFYFYEFLTNRYKPSFVELHSGFCDMLESDLIFGLPLKIALQNRTCPLPPGEIYLRNMMIPAVPKNFPFPKGRIYYNGSFDNGSVNKLIVSGQIDMEIKVAKLRRNGKN